MTNENQTPKEEVTEQENAAGTALSKLFRQLMLRMNINESKFGELMDKWISKNTTPLNRTEELSIRGNLGAQLMGTKMSWGVFIKGLSLLNIDTTTINITATDADGNQVDASTIFKPKE